MPTKKKPNVEQVLTELADESRQDAANELRCIKPPIGCGQHITGFRDEESSREHKISGLCQKCQDVFWGVE